MDSFLWNSMSSTCNVFAYQSNTMKYRVKDLHNIIFHRVAIQKGFQWRHCVSQNFVYTQSIILKNIFKDMCKRYQCGYKNELEKVQVTWRKVYKNAMVYVASKNCSNLLRKFDSKPISNQKTIFPNRCPSFLSILLIFTHLKWRETQLQVGENSN